MRHIENLLLAHHTPDNHPLNAAIARFTDVVQKESNGRLQITVVPAGILDMQTSVTQLVAEGQIDLALVPFDRLSLHIKKCAFLGLPYIFNDAAHADRFIEEMLPEWINDDCACCGISYITSWEWGFHQITNSVRPIMTPSDLQGLRIRVPPNPERINTIARLGAHPVICDHQHFNDLIKRGRIDGQENPISFIYSQFLETTQTHLSILNYCYSGLTQIANQSRINALPIDLQDTIKNASKTTAQWIKDTTRPTEKTQLESLAISGVKITSPSTEQFKKRLEQTFEPTARKIGEIEFAFFMAMLEKIKP